MQPNKLNYEEEEPKLGAAGLPAGLDTLSIYHV